MKRQVLFVQGGGEDVHDTWDNHLVDSLSRELGNDYHIVYPRMPTESDPSYARWAPAIQKELKKLSDGAIVVGHSVGATVLIHVLAADPPPIKLAGIFLVAAPFIGEGGWPSDEVEPRPHLGDDLPGGVPVYLYHGSADEEVPPAHLKLYGHVIADAVTATLKGRDHQLGNDLKEVAGDIRSLG
jgi:predicted alpha/beta hydrolase family esterase